MYWTNFTKDEAKFCGPSILNTDVERHVQFEHQGADLWCNIAIFYTGKNHLKSLGNVQLQQDNSIKVNSGKLDYDSNINWQGLGRKLTFLIDR